MTVDYSNEVAEELKSIGTLESVQDVCKVWHKLKPILVTAQTILKLLYPPAATAIGLIISLFDGLCPKGVVADPPADAATLRKAHAELIAAWRPSSTGSASTCQSRCDEQYERDVAKCGDDLTCINAAFGRYIICVLKCSHP
jgi:hypothetical protein